MIEEPVSEDRRLWKYLIFGFLTLGIYGLIFMWDMFRDVNRVCGYVENGDEDRSPNYLVFFLLSLITLGIYSYVWYYKQGNRIKRAGKAYGFEIDETGGTYVLWCLFGVFLFGIGPLVALYLFICNMNRLARAYNDRAVRKERHGGAYSGKDGVPPMTSPGKPGDGSRQWESGQSKTPVRSYGGGIYVDDSISTESVRAGTIECISGDYGGARITMAPGESLLIGRNSQACQIVLTDKDISRIHCSIRFDGEEKRFYVADLSRYGTTYLNDTIQLKRGVDRPCPLGSKLTLGNGRNQFILK